MLSLAAKNLWMTPWEVIEEALARRKRKPQWLADQLHVTAQVMTNWKTRKVPPARYREISEALGITVDQLEGLEPLPWQEHDGWPFPKVPRERWEALDDDDKGYVQRKLLQAIDDCAAGSRAAESAAAFRRNLAQQTKVKSAKKTG